jgi:Tfp pilus assembly protein PilV
MAAIILSIGVVAMLSALQAAAGINHDAAQRANAVFLVQEIREWTVHLPMADPGDGEAYNDIWDLDDAAFSPPRDGQGAVMTESGLSAWTQRVDVGYRSAQDLTTPLPDGQISNLVYVQVQAWNADEMVLETGWIASPQ